MILKDKLAREDGKRIWLYREGLFWKLYNESAYSFLKLVKSYQVKVKYVKEVKATVASIGFPDAVLRFNLDVLNTHTLSVDETDREIEIKLKEVVGGYMEWFEEMKNKETLPLTVNKWPVVSQPPAAKETDNDEIIRLVKELRDFPLMQKTPLEVQMFVMELQGKINKLEFDNWK